LKAPFLISGTAFFSLLEWIYAERFNPSPDSVQLLLGLADEYSLPLLVSKCETLIMGGVDETNIFDVLQFADTFHANKLKQHCIDYMASPSFPSHLLSSMQFKPEGIEQIHQQQCCWNDHSRSRRLDALRRLRSCCYEEEMKWQGKNIPFLLFLRSLV